MASLTFPKVKIVIN